MSCISTYAVSQTMSRQNKFISYLFMTTFRVRIHQVSSMTKEYIKLTIEETQESLPNHANASVLSHGGLPQHRSETKGPRSFTGQENQDLAKI